MKLPALLLKPHICRAQPYDGDGWICYVPFTRGGDDSETGFGRTPALAYASWSRRNASRRVFISHFYTTDDVRRMMQ